MKWKYKRNWSGKNVTGDDEEENVVDKKARKKVSSR